MLYSFKTTLILGLAFCCTSFLRHEAVEAFQLSMVASRAPLGNIGGSTLQKRPGLQVPKKTQSAGGVTSGLISQLAVTALKLRLHGQTHVSCDVTANPTDILLRGLVGPVTVKGRGWQSRLGLTCRAIEAAVDSCELDVGRILSNRKLVLTTPAQGNAMVALNAVDFGNFITHPLMRPPGLEEDSTGKLEFVKEDVEIDVAAGEISFYGTYLDRKWTFKLGRTEREGGKALIRAIPPQDADPDNTTDYNDVAEKLTVATSNFFNNMVFELDGTFLTFRDMMLTVKGGGATVMLSLGILVRKFPSAGLEF